MKVMIVTFVSTERALRYVRTTASGDDITVDDRRVTIVADADIIDHLALTLGNNDNVCSVHVECYEEKE